MARIYDNIESKFIDGLHDIMKEPGVSRVDFCVGYFNLRGWNFICDKIDNIPGDNVFESDSNGNDVKRFIFFYDGLKVYSQSACANAIDYVFMHN